MRVFNVEEGNRFGTQESSKWKDVNPRALSYGKATIEDI